MSKKQIIKKSSLVPTALISGGAGFIGSHLAEALLANNARVIVLDNFNTGRDVYIKQFLNNPNFALYNVDINLGIPEEIESVDYVFHLAGVEEYLYSKDLLNLDSLLTNSLGTKNLLDLAQRSEGKFLLVSTIDVYQGRMSQFDIEKYFGITSLEDNKFSLTEAKRFAEAVVWEYFKRHSTNVRIVRLPEVYGPRMSLDSSGNLGSYLRNIIEGHIINIYGDGLEKEQYLYVNDAVSGILKAMFGEHTQGSIYSLVWGEPISALETAYVVKSLADGDVDIVFKPELNTALPSVLTPDTFNLKDLNWKPKYNLKEGIVKTLEWFGYAANNNYFKPSKYIQQKSEEKSKNNGELFSLNDVKNQTPQNPVNFSSSQVATAAPVLNPAVSKSETATKSQMASLNLNPTDGSASPLEKKKLFSWLSLKKLLAFRKSAPIYAPDSGSAPSKIKYAYYALSVAVSAFLVFLILPALSVYFNASSGIKSLNRLQSSALELKSEDISVEAGNASKKFTQAKRYLGTTKWFFNLSGKNDIYETLDKSFSSLSYFSLAVGNISAGVKPVENLWETIRPDSTSTLNREALDAASYGLTNARNYLKLAEADAEHIDLNYIPDQYKDEVSTYKNILTKADENLVSLNSFLMEIPSILGSDEERKYLIWFQNSNEIRPTGGFVGSYGILTFDKGRIKNLVIDDIYNPDGQIKVREIAVAPPGPIQEFLNEDQLFLRNSNWSPDFPTSVLAFDDLYFKVTGQKMDGYIAVDLQFVEQLIKVTGPIFLAAYNEEINADNLYERAQYHSDFNYTNGSDQKRSFLTVLGGKLMERLFALKRESMPELISAINTSFVERHLMISLANSPLSPILKEKKWDGSLVQSDGDYLSVVNANVGGTKANYFVKNDMTYEVSSLTRDGLLRGVLTLKYKHTGTKDSWPGGPYTNYVRVLTQAGAKLTGATVSQTDTPETDIFENIVISKEGNYTSFGTSFKLETGNEAILVFTYDLPVNLSFTKTMTDYKLYWQKQAGTSQDTFKFVFNPPFGLTFVDKSSNIQIGEEALNSSGTVSEDLQFWVKLK